MTINMIRFMTLISFTYMVAAGQEFNYSHSVIVNKQHNNCTLVKHLFRQEIGVVMECALKNSDNGFSFCKKCSTEFTTFQYFYNRLKNETDIDKKMPCADEVFNIDRINIWQRMYQDIENLWEESHCYQCFDKWIDPTDENQNVTQVLSNDTKQFFEDITLLNNCLNSNKASPCTACTQEYQNLNNFFENLKKSSEKSDLCFDVVSAMNKTRRYWSGDLKCCQDKHTEYLLLIVTSSFCAAIAVLFYISAFFITKQNENRTVTVLLDEEVNSAGSINNGDAVPETSASSSSTAIVADLDDNQEQNNQKELANIKISNIIKQNNLDPRNLAQPTTLNSNQESLLNPSERLIDLHN